MTLKLTVEQALQEATSALNDGKLREAEHLFRDILKDQKKNPYINNDSKVATEFHLYD